MPKADELADLARQTAFQVCAMLDRVTARDVFDVGRLPEVAGRDWGTDALQNIAVAMCGTLPQAVYAYGHDRIARLTQADVEQYLHPLLLRGERPGAAELVQAAWSVVNGLVRLTEAQREFVDRLQQGELRPDLLFPEDEALAERLRCHPPLRWKAQNAAEHWSAGR